MGRKRNESLLEIAIESAWPVSAAISCMILFFGYVVLPTMFGSNPILQGVASGVKPFIFFGA